MEGLPYQILKLHIKAFATNLFHQRTIRLSYRSLK